MEPACSSGCPTPSTRRALDYRLTDKGRDLWPVLTAMRQWGDRYGAPAGPPIEIVHRGCGHVTHVEVVCDQCGERLSAREVRAVPGSGRTGLEPRARAAG